MPGLLQTEEYEVWSARFIAACLAEFGGVALFTLYGQSAPIGWAPWSNGIVLAILGAPPPRPARRPWPAADPNPDAHHGPGQHHSLNSFSMQCSRR